MSITGSLAEGSFAARAGTWARRAVAYAISLVVHLGTLAFFALGVQTIARAPQYTFAWLFGGLFAAIGVLLRPRMPKLARDAEPLTREAAPALHAMADRVADRAGVPRPALIAVRDLAAGTTYERTGLRRCPVLTIGLPLWLATSPAQRVALLAAACTRPDTADDLVVGGALATLGHWRHALLSSEPLSARQRAQEQMQFTLGAYGAPDTSYEAAGTFGRAVGRVLGAPVLLLDLALRRLVRRDTALAAERAARRAAEIASPGALAEVEAALAAPGGLVAPLQAAALRGENAAAIRQAALARAVETPSEGPVRSLLSDGESAAVDEELLAHYTRALRGFSLIT
ncbi:M48 family metallopeptidase [Spongiactinospora sp. 9N601]|uniref:M48 family metallopeptidase n=1 Tax=Spongiactinospora sp. 9N601 TaxID=3375149 RepID=UPI003789CA11